MTDMASSNEPENRTPHGIDERLVEEMQRIDNEFLDALNDRRLESGLPQEEQASEEEFIRMSGLTYGGREETAGSVLRPEPAHESTPPEPPLSFYEIGIADVDAGMTPGAIEEDMPHEADVISGAGQPSPVEELRDIITDLSRGVAHSQAAKEPASGAAGAGPSFGTEDIIVVGEQADSDGIPDTLPSPAQRAPRTEPEQASECPEGPADAGSFDRAPSREPDFKKQDPPELAKAQALLEELESQPRYGEEDDDIKAEDTRGEAVSPQVPKAPPDVVPAAKQSARIEPEPLGHADVPAQPLRESRPAATRPGRFTRYVIALAVLGALALGGYEAWVFARQRLNSPEALLSQASRYVSRGEYEAAMEQYERVAQALPASVPDRAEALFAAASSAFAAGNNAAGAKEAGQAALRLLEQFQKEFPGHAKTARAKTMLGIICFKLGQPKRAIETLRDPELLLRDPGGALAALRTLARAHARLGEYDMAREASLQAARLDGNCTPDQDYGEISLMYEKLAEYSEIPEARREYLETALQHWRLAADVPGLDMLREDELRQRIALLESKLKAWAPQQSKQETAPPNEGAG